MSNQPRITPAFSGSSFWLAGALALAAATEGRAQAVGSVHDHLKLSQLANFGGTLADSDAFGASLTRLGDVDGDGRIDVAAGASQAGTTGPGEVWVLLLATDGSVKARQKIGSGSGGFTGPLDAADQFGAGVAGMGDMDGDGVPDLIVGAPEDDDGSPSVGAIWVLFLNNDGSVKFHQKISSDVGAFTAELHLGDRFGASLAAVGDLDGDGISELAASAPFDDDGANAAGAVWVVFFDHAGRVKGQKKISALHGGFTGVLGAGDHFGGGVGGAGDLDGDGVRDLLVGAPGDDTAGADAGALWVVFLNADGTAKGQQKVASGVGGLADLLGAGDRFGSSIAAAPPVGGGVTGVPAGPVVNVAVGAPGDDDGGADRGALWVLEVSAAGLVTGQQKVSATSGGFAGVLHDGDGFGSALADPGNDDDGLGLPRLLAGAPGDDDGGAGRGAAWMLTFTGSEGPPVFTIGGNALLGRPGHPTLVLPHPNAPGDDFIGKPVVVSPSHNGSGGTTQSATADPGGGVTIGDPTQFETGQRPAAAATGDFTGDGQDDFVTANTGSNDFSLLRQVSSVGDAGVFAPHVDFALPFDGAPVRVRVGDFDDDDKLDVVVAGDAGVTLFRGDGAGGFVVADFEAVALLTDLAVDDVDEDGNLDVVTASGAIAAGPGLEQGFATVLLGDGTGNLTPHGTFQAGKALVSVLLADFDADVHRDALVVVHEIDGGPGGVPQARIALHHGDGDGGFTHGPGADVLSPNPDGVHPAYGAVADLDNDGRNDAVYTSGDNIAFPLGAFGAEQPPLVLTLLRNDDAGGFDVTSLGTAWVGKGVTPLLTDFVPAPPDGNVDCLLVWSQDTLAGQGGTGDEGFLTFVAALVGDGAGSFIDPDPNHFLTGLEPGNPDVGEVGGPGDGGTGGPDVLVPNIKSNSLTVVLGDGHGGAAGTVTVANVDQLDPGTLPGAGIWQGGPRDVRAGQLDGDGRLDAVVYNEWDDLAGFFDPVASLSLFLGNGSGEFAPSQYVPMPRAGDVVVADAIGSASTDVIVTQRIPGAPGEVRILAGGGNGTVSKPGVLLPVPAGHELSGGLAVADVDIDGDRDVVTTVRDGVTGSGKVLLFRRSGASFGAELFEVSATWSEVRSIDVGDLTGDGVPDIAIGLQDGQLFVAAGSAADALTAPGAAFGSIELSAAAASVGGGALRLGTLDGDGHLDIVSSNASTPGQIDQAFVRELRGAGGGQFQVNTLPGVASVGGQGALRPVLRDMNGDGATDLVVVHSDAGLLSILVNNLNSTIAFGSGKPGKGGLTPLFTAQGYTTLGGVITLRLQDAVGGAPALLLVGTGQLPTGFLAVENLAYSILLQLTGTPGVAGAGGVVLPSHMPPESRYIGLTFTLQMLVLDPAAGNPGPAKLAFSNGLAITILP